MRRKCLWHPIMALCVGATNEKYVYIIILRDFRLHTREANLLYIRTRKKDVRLYAFCVYEHI